MHRFLEFDPDPQLPGGTSTKLLYSIVDMNANNSFGDVKSKNQIVIEKHLSGGDLTAVRHANNIDWWILDLDAQMIYITAYNDGKWPQPFQTMQLGIPMQYLDDGGSQSCFSPDGTKYARMTPVPDCFFGF
ncbi:MAG: hypothetical protein IPG87_21030 [Saprospiraceae bacterium]|nr:hypothetical protein [Candidatus Vicinibacter affinis]